MLTRSAPWIETWRAWRRESFTRRSGRGKYGREVSPGSGHTIRRSILAQRRSGATFRHQARPPLARTVARMRFGVSVTGYRQPSTVTAVRSPASGHRQPATVHCPPATDSSRGDAESAEEWNRRWAPVTPPSGSTLVPFVIFCRLPIVGSKRGEEASRAS